MPSPAGRSSGALVVDPEQYRAIRDAYRLGVAKGAHIASRAGFAPSNMVTRAEVDGWQRDLAGHLRATVRRRLAEADAIVIEGLDLAELLEHGATRGVIVSEREAITADDLLEAASRLAEDLRDHRTRLAAALAEAERLASQEKEPGGPAALALAEARLAVATALPDTIAAFTKLAMAIERAIGMRNALVGADLGGAEGAAELYDYITGHSLSLLAPASPGAEPGDREPGGWVRDVEMRHFQRIASSGRRHQSDQLSLAL